MDISILLQIQGPLTWRHRLASRWGDLFCCATAHALHQAWGYRRRPVWHPEKQIKKNQRTGQFRFVPFIDIYGPWRRTRIFHLKIR